MYINKFTISVIFKCTIQWLKYIHIFVQENKFLTMVNVHYNWVEKNRIERQISKVLFLQVTWNSTLSRLCNWKFRTTFELEMQFCSPHDAALTKGSVWRVDRHPNPYPWTHVQDHVSTVEKILGRIPVVDVSQTPALTTVILGKVLNAKSVFSPMKALCGRLRAWMWLPSVNHGDPEPCRWARVFVHVLLSTWQPLFHWKQGSCAEIINSFFLQ